MFSSATQIVVWSLATIGLYHAAQWAHRHRPSLLLMPVVATPLALIGLLLILGSTYRDYIEGAGWLVAMVGPTTVAFAVPIYEKRATIRANWRVLAIGILAGSTTAIGTSYGLATLLHLDLALRASLLPRSFNMPFAVAISDIVGGVPNLTAFFVVVTGLTSAVAGHAVAKWLPLRSAISRGALLGMAGHGAGTAKAFELGREEGTIAGLVMIMAGLMNVAAAPLIAMAL